ncbi:MAG: SCO family protein [Myxococcota bacterium]|nr:SCO family protein [Myxococcota bacterium]
MQQEKSSDESPMDRADPGRGSRGGRDWVTLGILGVLALSVVSLVIMALRAIPEAAPDPGEHARVLVTPIEIPEFSLMDHRGELFDRSRLEGHWSLLFFGYTSCPDICPFVLQELAKVKRGFDDRESPVREMPDVVFISVDPQRDSEDRLAEYVEFFDPSFTGVSGPDSELQELTRSIGAYYEAPSGEAGDSYLVNHASKLFLIDPSGRFLALLDDPHDPEEFIDLLAKVQTRGESKP